MERRITSELIDQLPQEDPRAVKTRRDLLRINAWMGHAHIMARVLQNAFARHLSFRIVDIGGGDGEFLLRVANRIRGRWRRLDVTVVDSQDLLQPQTRERFSEFQWHVNSAKDDIFNWLQQSSDEKIEAIVANLFLHHLNNEQLRTLFTQAATKADVFIAVEPRRSYWPLFCSRLVPLIGCGAVTAHDAPASVRAGFRDAELSALWPDHANWDLIEKRAGWFSHLFVAKRKERRAHMDHALFEPTVSAVFNRSASATVDSSDAERADAQPDQKSRSQSNR